MRPKTERAKDFLEYVKANYTKVDKAEMATHLKLLTTTVYDGVSGSLPVSFDAVKLTYNALKEEWTLEELMSIVVQHEVSLKKMRLTPLLFSRGKGIQIKEPPTSVSSNAAKSEKFKGKCNFCHKIGHKQVDCFKFKNWLEKKKKGEIVVVVNLNANMIETNIVDVHANSWWLDTGATIHVTNSLQEMTNRRKPSKHEECVYMGDGSKVKVEFFGMIKLKLITESFLLLHNVAFIPSLRRNLISVSSLDRHGYLFTLEGKMTAKTRKEKIDRFGYVELIHEKSDSLNVFKAFKAKVELQLGKPIKAVKSDRGGEYYGRYDETGRNPGPFAKFLLECGIDANIHCQALLNRMGLQKGGIAHSEACQAYNPQSKKLDPKTISGFFVGYCIGSRGSRFYCPSHTTRIIELKLDPKTISGFFVGYCIGSRGSRFYCPSHTTRIIELDRVVYFEDVSSVDERSSGI
ncbi:hypothetical protein CK203_024165 [Vitis vinifera]|uniref:Retrovirus-related Pol polyprotein from transposon TNT 1-94 n=1 Tax=Vitis vinifera TaxID=29760 RepID=A0A438I4Q7_VITVI|nr:hypothetical protein CK203_024165 [Vitis vinifera]